MLDVLSEFDRYLARRGHRFEAVVIGGAALIIMGVVKRTTKDVDCLDPVIPDPVKNASITFARQRPDLGLAEDWLNNGPSSLVPDLPAEWRENLCDLYFGQAIRLRTLGRLDMLRTKLFAFCDRQEDGPDCEALAPTAEELDACLPWLLVRDAHPKWPDHVRTMLRSLGERLGYDYRPFS